MKPIAVNGHSRSLTQVKYNREGDLLFSVSKDSTPSVWYSHDGTRERRPLRQRGYEEMRRTETRERERRERERERDRQRTLCNSVVLTLFLPLRVRGE